MDKDRLRIVYVTFHKPISLRYVFLEGRGIARIKLFVTELLQDSMEFSNLILQNGRGNICMFFVNFHRPINLRYVFLGG